MQITTYNMKCIIQKIQYTKYNAYNIIHKMQNIYTYITKHRLKYMHEIQCLGENAEKNV
jgi:hypothetical protein